MKTKAGSCSKSISDLSRKGLRNRFRNLRRKVMARFAEQPTHAAAEALAAYPSFKEWARSAAG